MREEQINGDQQIGDGCAWLAEYVGERGFNRLAGLDPLMRPCLERHETGHYRVGPAAAARPSIRLDPWEEPVSLGKGDRESIRSWRATIRRDGNRVIDEPSDQGQPIARRVPEQFQERARR